MAGLALLLASPAGAFINGQTIGVDGGASAWQALSGALNKAERRESASVESGI